MGIVVRAGRRHGWGTSAPAPTYPPGPPTNVTAVAGNGQATVSWTPPTLTSLMPALTKYTVVVSPGGTTVDVAATQTSYTVTGLANGTAYTFQVSATNSAGTSVLSTASAPVTPTAPVSSTFDPDTYDFVGNTGVAVPWSQLAVSYGSQTPTKFSGGTGTASDPYILEKLHIRNDPAKNIIGQPTQQNANSAIMTVNKNYVTVRNCRVPAAFVASANSNVRFENCEIGLWDYYGSTTPTVDRYTGNAIATTAFRQFWFDTSTLTGYFIDPSIGVTTWTYGAETWAYMCYYDPTVGDPTHNPPILPVTPQVGEAWVYTNHGTTFEVDLWTDGQAYHRWDGTKWVGIDSTVCPDMVFSNNGQNLEGLTLRDHCTAYKCRVFGIEDTIWFGGNGDIRVHLSWIRNNCQTRARFQPHGDLMQSVGGSGAIGMYIQQSYIDADGDTFGSIALRGAPFSSSGIFKTDSGNISDVLISQCKVKPNGAHCFQFRTGTSNPTPPSNIRVRNCAFVLKTPGENVIDAQPNGGNWSGNKVSGTSTVILPGSNGVPTSWTDDGDPTGEGTTLK